MTSKEKFDAEEKKERILQKAGYQCRSCGKPAVSLAHRIAQTKSNLKKYGKEIIHHEYNLAAVCERQACNDAFNIGGRLVERDFIVAWIRRAIKEGVDRGP